MRMNRLYLTPGLIAAAIAGAALAHPSLVQPALAQQALELPSPSPAAKVSQRVGVTDIAIEYSSPAAKGRKIWGDLVPFDKVWRTGANAATKITFSKDVTFGGQALKAGSYALVTLPSAKGWTLILNKDTAIFSGGKNYDEKEDALRVAAKVEAIPNRERLTFLFSDTSDDATRLDLEWEKLRISVAISVDTAGHAKANIDAATKGAWRPLANAARYLSETAKDQPGALVLVDKSLALESAWFNSWIKAQILQRQGKGADALVWAKKALDLGAKDSYFWGKADVEKALLEWKK
jgi:hypothetical protein